MWEWLMRLFRTQPESADAHKERVRALRALEREEKQAVSRVVTAGVKASIEADKASEKAEEITDRLTQCCPERGRGDSVIMTAETALRLLERDKGRGR